MFIFSKKELFHLVLSFRQMLIMVGKVVPILKTSQSTKTDGQEI